MTDKSQVTARQVHAVSLTQPPTRAGIVSSALVFLLAASRIDPLLAEQPPQEGIEVAAAQGPYFGDRTPPPPAKVSPAETQPREWFGSTLPWWDWARVSGDWAGARTSLEDRGVSLNGKYTLDVSSVFSGGVQQRSVGRGLLDLNLTFDPKPMLGIEGGRFFAQFFYRHGPNGSDDTGALQAGSNIDAPPLSRLGELWYEQWLFAKRVRVKLGQVDANSEFAFLNAAGDFLTASTALSPTLHSIPTYPDPALGINVFVYPTANLYVGAALYDGTLNHSVEHSFQRPFWIAEIGATFSGSGHWGAGRCAVGGWYDGNQFDRFNDRRERGTGGFYSVLEQQLWRANPSIKDDTRGVSGFIRYGYADEEVSDVAHHLGIGLVAVGLVPARQTDSTGVGMNWVRLSRATGAGYRHDETSLEWFYKFKCTPFLSIQPDLQWIFNPAGRADIGDAVVVAVRCKLVL